MRTSLLALVALLAGCAPDSSDLQGDAIARGGARGAADTLVCHNGTNLWVNSQAVNGHLNHGDVLPSTWFEDLDGDGYGDAGSSVVDCNQPTSFVSDDSDCDDSDALVNPGEAELAYNGIDDDCDASTPDDDLDGDGYGFADDCDDSDALVNPGEAELAYDGIDNDCDAGTPDDDLDGDGYGFADDCDDSDSTTSPGEAEACDDGLDNNCDGQVDEGCTPATEVCGDGIDNDGDGEIDERCDNGVGELCVEVLLHCDPSSAVLQTFCGSGVQPVVGQVRSNASYILLGAGVNGAVIQNSAGTVVTITNDTNLCGIGGFNDRLTALEVF